MNIDKLINKISWDKYYNPNFNWANKEKRYIKRLKNFSTEKQKGL